MILLNVMYTLKGIGKEDFVRLLRDNDIIEESRQESGNIRYEFFYPAEDNHDILLVEEWVDDAAFEAHKKTPHYAALQEIKLQYIRDISIEKFSK